MLKKILYTLALLFILVVIGYRLADEPRPEGEQGPRAEYLTEKMLEAVNYSAWQDINTISWSYPRGHDFIWDKKSNLVQVKWDDYRVLLNPDNRSGKVYENNEEVKEGKGELLQKAFKYFANDSFWLIAPFKAKDPGTVQSVVMYEGEEALMIEYTSGGVTPGDAYLWILDENGLPIAWKFWVQLVPVGGLYFTWEEWVSLNGPKISTFHDGLLNIEITNLKVAENAAELNNGKDPFAAIR